MANTSLTIDMITSEALRVLHQKCNFVRSINRQYDDQYARAKTVFVKALQVLGPYLPARDEEVQVRDVLAGLDFPTWVVNWDYELESDEDGVAALWVMVFVDDTVPPDQYGRRATELIPRLRTALASAGIHRWPYVRMRTAKEHKSR